MVCYVTQLQEVSASCNLTIMQWHGKGPKQTLPRWSQCSLSTSIWND